MSTIQSSLGRNLCDTDEFALDCDAVLLVLHNFAAPLSSAHMEELCSQVADIPLDRVSVVVANLLAWGYITNSYELTAHGRILVESLTCAAKNKQEMH